MVTFPLQKRQAILAAGVVLAVLLFIPAAMGVFYYQADQNLSARVYLQQQTLTNLAASAVKIKIDRLVGIAESMASSTQIIKSTANDRWNDAAQSASDLQNDVTYYDPFIDRIIFYSVDGIQKAAYPTLVGGIGSSAVSSSWYQALNQGQDSYISGVTRRLSMPQINVVNVAVPIRADGAIKGFLVLQIPTDNFLEFGTDLSLGTYGFTYIVDTKGNLVAHPQFSSQTAGVVVSYAFTPAVKEIMAGRAGTLVVLDSNGDEKSIVTYDPLPQYEWGVVVQEPYNEAFAVRDSILFSHFVEIMITLVIDLLLSYLVYRVVTSKRSEHKKS